MARWLRAETHRASREAAHLSNQGGNHYGEHQ
nr:MAG TPA: hypothetical protein [Caudoviricetes sp.]